MTAKSTFLQQARRKQLVALAIEVIGESGLAAASVSAIARRAGTSRGVVDYNVGDRDQLMSLVVTHVYELGRAEVRPAVDAAADPHAAIAAFVSASLDFYAARPAEMRALREIFGDRDLVDRISTPEHQHELDDLLALVQEGQTSGVVGDLDPRLTTAVLRAALDHAAAAVAAGDDLETLRERLAALVDRLLVPAA